MTYHSREEIIDILYKDFQELIPKETIEESLIKFSFISICSKEWLKKHYIDKQLSAKEIATTSMRESVREIAESFHLEVQREKELKQIQYR